MQRKSTFKIFVLFTIVLVNTGFLFGQNWVVPAEKKAKASPFLFTEVTSKQGEAVYTKNCQSCHGNPGKDNALKSLTPQPPDPAADKMQKNTDGEIFYKISEGKAIMPSFKNILSETDRWDIISYIRSFNKSYTQAAINTNASTSSPVKIRVKFDSITKKLIFSAKKATKKDSVPVVDAETEIFVMRYFGNMQLDSSQQTNDSGIVAFSIPEKLPGDSTGFLKIIVKMNDDATGEKSDTFKLKIGVPTIVPGLTANRAMWNVVSKSPVWLLATYFSILLGVWVFLIYVITRLVKLKKLGKETK